MKVLTAVLTLILLASAAGPASSQVPFLTIYDSPTPSSVYHCGTPGTTAELFVVAHNLNFRVSAMDFSVLYPPTMFWLYDQLSDASILPSERTVITIGSSPTGIAMAWANCCMPDGTQGSFIVLRPVVYWFGGCTCSNGYLSVGGYTPLGKTRPSAVRHPDFTEFSLIAGTSYLNHCDLPVESKTWGAVKALYR